MLKKIMCVLAFMTGFACAQPIVSTMPELKTEHQDTDEVVRKPGLTARKRMLQMKCDFYEFQNQTQESTLQMKKGEMILTQAAADNEKMYKVFNVDTYSQGYMLKSCFIKSPQ